MEIHIHKWVPLDEVSAFEDGLTFGFTAEYFDVCTRCGIVRIKEHYMPRKGGVSFSDGDRTELKQNE